MSAYRLPKGNESEVVVRRAAIQSAMIYAARVPLQNAEHCLRVSDLAGRLAGRANPRTASDLQCAVYLASAGLQGCLANVEINLASIKDPLVVGELRLRVEGLRQA
jgi:glutamate formiminotransferase/formiminotetrahydrofolate cyclodeaminase